MLDLGMTLHKMGEEAVIDLAAFSLEGPARKRLRTTYARAGRDGLTLRSLRRRIPPPCWPSCAASRTNGWPARNPAKRGSLSAASIPTG